MIRRACAMRSAQAEEGRGCLAQFAPRHRFTRMNGHGQLHLGERRWLHAIEFKTDPQLFHIQDVKLRPLVLQEQKVRRFHELQKLLDLLGLVISCQAGVLSRVHPEDARRFYRSITIARSHGASVSGCPFFTTAFVSRSIPSPDGYEIDCCRPEKLR